MLQNTRNKAVALCKWHGGSCYQLLYEPRGRGSRPAVSLSQVETLGKLPPAALAAHASVVVQRLKDEEDGCRRYA